MQRRCSPPRGGTDERAATVFHLGSTDHRAPREYFGGGPGTPSKTRGNLRCVLSNVGEPDCATESPAQH
eukprot:scaffold128343_cov30-Tisochrysis_lutea.AAC.6